MEEIKFDSGKASTRIPSFHLIPAAALVAYAQRLERGVRLKGDGAWNASTQDQESVMKDRKFVIDRLSHCINHCLDAIARLRGQIPYEAEEEADGGDAGAIMFAGGLLAAVRQYEQSRIVAPTPPPAAPGKAPDEVIAASGFVPWSNVADV
jgi:hypothetical protein